MTIGAEIPFRRSHFAQGTGSLILDRQREDNARDADKNDKLMRVWSAQGRFVKA